MKYKYKLVENTGGEDTPIGGGSKGIPKSSVDIVLTPSSDTTVKDIEDALSNPENYEGKFITDKNLKQAVDDFYGPSGGFGVKKGAAKKAWNASDKSWKELKIKDIKKRNPKMDFTEINFEANFESLPEKIQDPKVFYPPFRTKDGITSIQSDIKNLKVKELLWEKTKENTLIFSHLSNPSVEKTKKMIKDVINTANEIAKANEKEAKQLDYSLEEIPAPDENKIREVIKEQLKKLINKK